MSPVVQNRRDRCCLSPWLLSLWRIGPGLWNPVRFCSSTNLFCLEGLIERCGRNVVQVVGDGFQSDAQQKFHDLLLAIAGTQKSLDRLLFHETAFLNNFPREIDQRIRLLVGNRRTVADCQDDLRRRVQKSFRDGGMSRCAVSALVFDAYCKQDELAFDARERAFPKMLSSAR